MNKSELFTLVLLLGFSFSCKEEYDNPEPTPDPQGNVNVTLTLSNNQTVSFTMHDGRFILDCEDSWLIHGAQLTNNGETVEIRRLNIVMDPLNMNLPVMYSGEAEMGDGPNEVLRNGVEYSITSATYSILEYDVIQNDTNGYLAEVVGSYFIEMESPTGDQESLLVSFSPMLQTAFGGGC